jgi:hypothetical protein
MKRLSALLLLAASAAANAAALPDNIKAEYELSNRGVTIGRVHETFVRSGDTYTINSVSRSEGILKLLYDDQITYHSKGQVDANGLKPLQFEERRTRDPKRFDVKATFDWERGVLRSRFRGESSEHALPPATQDRISMMYQFMHVQPRSGTLSIHMSNGRKVERYLYRFVGEVRIATRAGDFDTLHLERITEGPKESRVEVWLAKDRHNMPVRVVFDDPRGLRVEQNLVALQSS